jgi:hypothetical protein
MDNGLDKVGFLERQQHGGGHYLSPDEIERRHPQLFTDLLQMMPGLHVSNQGTGRTVESSRPGGCINIFVDNARFESYQPGDIDGAFSPSNIGAVETYSSSGETPAQFMVPGKACGTVVMWTKERLLRP